MPMLRLRLMGRQDDATALITVLHGIDGIEHVEQVADLMPHMDDEDSSSAGLPDDMAANVYEIEVEAPDAERVERVRRAAEHLVETLGLELEFVDDF